MVTLFRLLRLMALTIAVIMLSGSPKALADFNNPTLSEQLQWPWYTADGGATGSSAACGGTGNLPSFVPEPYNSVFTKAGAAYNVSPQLIAALFTSENMTHILPEKIPAEWQVILKQYPDPNKGWPTSSANAQGPFQFIPGTWTSLGVDGDGDGVKDVNNLTDAAFAAANYAKSDGATVDKPPDSWHDFIFSYNHAEWYVQMTMQYYQYYAKSGTGDGKNVTSVTCGNTGVSPDGFVFPQKTTKAQLASENPQYFSPTCTNPVSEMGPNPPTQDPSKYQQRDGMCHHDYLAADISNATGVPVLSPRPGRVVRGGDNGDLGYTISIYSDKALGGDGNTYYLAHMLRPSEGGKILVSVGSTVKAGQQVGAVGTDADAQSTHHHTHIDISPVNVGFHRSYDGTGGPLLDPQPPLKAAYEGLADR